MRPFFTLGSLFVFALLIAGCGKNTATAARSLAVPASERTVWIAIAGDTRSAASGNARSYSRDLAIAQAISDCRNVAHNPNADCQRVSDTDGKYGYPCIASVVKISGSYYAWFGGIGKDIVGARDQAFGGCQASPQPGSCSTQFSFCQ